MKISCIIPVYNEAARVGGVLSAVVGHELVDEIIVVNDGSTDNSEQLLQQTPGITLISYKPNRGKSHAVMTGFLKSRNDTVLMLDSDLIGLTKDDVTALIDPVRRGIADVSISLRGNSLLLYKFFKLDYVSGERVFDKRIIPDLGQLDQIPGFGLETYLNRIITEKKLRLAVVNLKNVITPRKSVKEGFWLGALNDYKMVRQIIKYQSFFGVVKQFSGMLAQKVQIK